MEWMAFNEDNRPDNEVEFQGWLIVDGDEETGFWEPRCMFNDDEQLGLYGRIDYDCDGWDYGLTHLTLTHWQPLPSPPRESG